MSLGGIGRKEVRIVGVGLYIIGMGGASRISIIHGDLAIDRTELDRNARDEKEAILDQIGQF